MFKNSAAMKILLNDQLLGKSHFWSWCRTTCQELVLKNIMLNEVRNQIRVGKRKGKGLHLHLPSSLESFVSVV
jgi:hypothetical protein